MNSIMLRVSHLALPFMDGVKDRTPSFRSLPGSTSGMLDASSTFIVALSEMIPPVWALMKVANSVLCAELLPNLLHEAAPETSRRAARIYGTAFFISL